MKEKQRKRIPKIFFAVLGFIIIIIIFLLLAPNIFQGFVNSKIPGTVAQIYGTQNVLENYRSEVGRYPSTSQGLKALYEKPAGLDGGKWMGPYLSKQMIPKDVWNRDLLYQCPGTHNPESYDLWSYGKDGKPGGTGRNADVGNW